MSSGIETEIKKLLNLLPNRNQVADELLKKWHRAVLSNKEIDELAQFLFQLGLHKSLLAEIKYQSEKKTYLPVDVCLQLIDLYSEKLNFDETWINAIYLWAESSGTTDSLIRLDALIEKDTRLKKLRELSIDTDLGHKHRNLQVNERSLAALISDQLWAEAKTLATEILANFPENKVASSALERVKYEQAVDTIKKQNKKYDSSLTACNSNFTSSRQEELTDAISALLDMAKLSPRWTYDIAAALYSMEAFEDALSLIADQNIETNEKAFLLKMEILLEQRKFYLCIDEIEKAIQTKQANNKKFLLNYLLAKSLWGSGEKQRALSIMEEIIKNRPNYRVAEHLVQEWKASMVS